MMKRAVLREQRVGLVVGEARRRASSRLAPGRAAARRAAGRPSGPPCRCRRRARPSWARIASGSMKLRAPRSGTPRPRPRSRARRGWSTAGPGSPGRDGSRSSPMPGVARQRERPALHELGARVGLRVVRRGAHQAAVEARASRRRSRASRCRPRRRRARRRPRRAARRRSARPARAPRGACRGPRPTRSSAAAAALAASASTRAKARPIAVGDVLVDLVGVEPADVVGLEDRRVDHRVTRAMPPVSAVVGVAEALGQHARVADHRHEVRVAAPARHHVQVHVVLDAGARRPRPG